jgi:hypothetical protein
MVVACFIQHFPKTQGLDDEIATLLALREAVRAAADTTGQKHVDSLATIDRWSARSPRPNGGVMPPILLATNPHAMDLHPQ